MPLGKAQQTVVMTLLAISVATAAFAQEPPPPPTDDLVEPPPPPETAPPPAESVALPLGAPDGIDKNLDIALRDAILELSKSGGSGDQIDPKLKALLRHRENMQAMRIGDVGHGDSPAVEILVPISFFAALVLIVAIPLFLRKRRREIDASVQKAAIEKGMQYVPEIPAAKRAAPNDKRTGLLIAGLGLAALLPLLLAGYTKWCLVGLAPMVLGAVYFIVGVLLPPEAEK